MEMEQEQGLGLGLKEIQESACPTDLFIRGSWGHKN